MSIKYQPQIQVPATKSTIGSVYGFADLSNTMLGFDAGRTGMHIQDNSYKGNTFIGRLAVGNDYGYNVNGQYGRLDGSKIGSHNTVVGSDSGTSIYGDDANGNIAIGYNSMSGGQSKMFQNISIGPDALSYTVAPEVSSNIGIGNSALKGTGGSLNIAIGQNSQSATWYPGGQQPGYGNISIGTNSLAANRYGYENIAFGSTAMWNNQSGDYNIAIGSFALQAQTDGDRNIAIGYSALGQAQGSMYNIAIGESAGLAAEPGSQYNTFIGVGAANGSISGSNNTVIGYASYPSTNSTSNEITLGNSSITNLRCNDTSISGLSDARDKTDVADITVGLGFVNELRPVTFTWDQRDGGRTGILDSGFIAQELMSVEDQYDANEWLKLTSRDNEDRYEAAPGRLIPVLVKAIQELSKKVEELEAKVL